MSPLERLAAVYSGRDTHVNRAVHAAVSAVLDGSCSNPVVVLGVENLRAHYEHRADLPEVERAERYLVECWTEHEAGGVQ
jgi:hypothetical protein